MHSHPWVCVLSMSLSLSARRCAAVDVVYVDWGTWACAVRAIRPLLANIGSGSPKSGIEHRFSFLSNPNLSQVNLYLVEKSGRSENIVTKSKRAFFLPLP